MFWSRGGDDKRPKKWGQKAAPKTQRPPANPPPKRGKGGTGRGRGKGQSGG
jgi:hypothetical protein